MITSYMSSFSAALNGTVITDAAGQTMDHDAGYNAMVEAVKKVRANNGTLFLIGNGGSSALISHTAIDLLNKCKVKAYPMTDNAMLTCMGNDYGYENVFRQPFDHVFGPNDGVIAVSSSGNSQNIWSAAQLAKERGGFVLTLSGFKTDNPLRTKGDLNMWVDTMDYGVAEIGHSLLLHILTDELQR